MYYAFAANRHNQYPLNVTNNQNAVKPFFFFFDLAKATKKRKTALEQDFNCILAKLG